MNEHPIASATDCWRLIVIGRSLVAPFPLLRYAGGGSGWGFARIVSRRNPHPNPPLFEPEPQSRRPAYRRRGQIASAGVGATALLLVKALVPLVIVLAWTATTLGASPATDPTVDWLMTQSTTAPTTQPGATATTTQPSSAPFETAAAGDRPGEILLSDGSTVRGKIATTAERPIRVWVEADKEYRDVPFEMIRTIEARVLWQSDEREWHFAASGSDVKEYSGKTYPARETSYTITLNDGTKVEGGVVAPLYVTGADGKTKTYVLHKRDKGEVGQKLEQLVYVKRVRFGD